MNEINNKCGCPPKKSKCEVTLVERPVCDPASTEAMGLYNGYLADRIEGKKYSIGEMVNDPATGAKYISLKNCNDNAFTGTSDDNWFMYKNTDNVDLDNTIQDVTSEGNVITVTREDGTSHELTIPTDIDNTVVTVAVDPEDSNKIKVVMEDGSATYFSRDTDNTVQSVTMYNGALVITLEDGQINTIPMNLCDKVKLIQFSSCQEMENYVGTDLCPLQDGQIAVVAGEHGCMEWYRYVSTTTITELAGEACGKYVGSVHSTTHKWIEYLECDGRVPDLMECVLPIGKPSLCERVTVLEDAIDNVVTNTTRNADGSITIDTAEGGTFNIPAIVIPPDMDTNIHAVSYTYNSTAHKYVITMNDGTTLDAVAPEDTYVTGFTFSNDKYIITLSNGNTFEAPCCAPKPVTVVSASTTFQQETKPGGTQGGQKFVRQGSLTVPAGTPRSVFQVASGNQAYAHSSQADDIGGTNVSSSFMGYKIQVNGVTVGRSAWSADHDTLYRGNTSDLSCNMVEQMTLKGGDVLTMEVEYGDHTEQGLTPMDSFLFTADSAYIELLQIKTI